MESDDQEMRLLPEEQEVGNKCIKKVVGICAIITCIVIGTFAAFQLFVLIDYSACRSGGNCDVYFYTILPYSRVNITGIDDKTYGASIVRTFMFLIAMLLLACVAIPLVLIVLASVISVTWMYFRIKESN